MHGPCKVCAYVGSPQKSQRNEALHQNALEFLFLFPSSIFFRCRSFVCLPLGLWIFQFNLFQLFAYRIFIHQLIRMLCFLHFPLNQHNQSTDDTCSIYNERRVFSAFLSILCEKISKSIYFHSMKKIRLKFIRLKEVLMNKLMNFMTKKKTSPIAEGQSAIFSFGY